MASIKDLTALKSKISGAKDNQLRAEGRLLELTKNLEEDHGCSSIEEAREKLSQIDTRIQKLEEKLDTGIEEVMNEHPI